MIPQIKTSITDSFKCQKNIKPHFQKCYAFIEKSDIVIDENTWISRLVQKLQSVLQLKGKKTHTHTKSLLVIYVNLDFHSLKMKEEI